MGAACEADVEVGEAAKGELKRIDATLRKLWKGLERHAAKEAKEREARDEATRQGRMQAKEESTREETARLCSALAEASAEVAGAKREAEGGGAAPFSIKRRRKGVKEES